MIRSKHLLQENYQFIVIVLLAIIVAAFFFLNAFDAGNLAAGSRNFFKGISPYEVEPYLNPPHSAILGSPTMLGLRVNAFVNAFFLLLLLGGKNSFFIFLSPFFVISIGGGNLLYVTALGIFLLLQRKQGVLRGLAWALLACRPQDAILIPIADALYAIRERDWKAFATAALIVVPPFLLYGPEWLSHLQARGSSPQEYTLSVRENWGIGVAILFFLLILALRTDFRLHLDHSQRWAFSRAEAFWLLIMTGWIFVTPYVTSYMLSLALLPFRAFSLRKKSHILRAIALYVALIVIFFIFFADPRGFEDDLWQRGFLFIPLTIALLMPRDLPEEKSEAVARSFSN